MNEQQFKALLDYIDTRIGLVVEGGNLSYFHQRRVDLKSEAIKAAGFDLNKNRSDK